MRRLLTYTVGEVAPYINWLYYFHAWGMEPRFATIAGIHHCPSCRASWIASFAPHEQPKAREAMKLYDEAAEQLRQWAHEPVCHALLLLAPVYSEGDDIIIEGRTRIPFLRQQHAERQGYTLCLSDFIAPAGYSSKGDGADIAHTMGIFATTVAQPQPSTLTLDPSGVDLRFNSQLSTFNFQFSTLRDRLAEATAEKMHEEVRKHYWGYAKDEQLTMHELHEEKFQGIRPAVGYPALPDQSVNFLIDELLHLKDIGISLSENGAMSPHCSVSGFLFAHPQARYFAVGSINEEQLTDYSHRRGLDYEQTRKFLSAIISHDNND